MTINIDTASLNDAYVMAPHMRAADVDEVRAASGHTPLEALVESIKASNGDAWTVRCNGEVLCIGGVMTSSLLTGRVVPWLLTSNAVDRHMKSFYKVTKNAIQALREQYDHMENVIDARHVVALRWARRLGFEIGKEESFGPEGRGFHRIIMKGARTWAA